MTDTFNNSSIITYNIRLVIQYDGSTFCGWQFQPNVRTVQGEIQKSLKSLYGEDIDIIASGRTDTGVHAIAQIANYLIKGKKFDEQIIVKALNFYLPYSVRVMQAQYVEANFHARFSAKKKTYMYRLYKSEIDSPLLYKKVLRISPNINVEKMREASRKFIGEHDFKTFMASGSDVKNTTRIVYSVNLNEYDNFIDFYITANGFLYNMVRIITACLLKVGSNKMSPDKIVELIENKDRNLARELAPPFALYLLNVEY